MKKKILLLTLLTMGISQGVLAENINDPVYNKERTNRLSFIPKLSFGKDTENDFEDGFRGIQADILYGINDNFEVGGTIGWTHYDLDYEPSLKSVLTSYDDDLNTFSLLGTARYTLNRGGAVSPYFTIRGGWVFGSARMKYEQASGGEGEAKIEGKWQVGVAGGIEFHNVNVEVGYKVTEFEGSIDSGRHEEFGKEKLVYVALGYRFE